MQIETGLFDHMVVQRAGRGGCDVELVGRSPVVGRLQARVTAKGKVVRPFDWKTIGKAARGKIAGRVRGLTAGGPYRVELRVVDDKGACLDGTIVRDVLVGDVWIAAGQSNMQGCGLLTAAAKPHRMVRAFYMDDRWDVAKDPIHNMWECVDQVHVDLGVVRGVPNTVTGVGPAVAFVQEMHRRTGAPQGVLACAHGGTSMAQWDPKLERLGGSSLYGATLRRVRKNGGRIAGIIWYQGESDASPDVAALFTARMKAFVRAFRRDLHDPELPFVAVQLGRLVGEGFDPASWNNIQEQQRLLPDAVRQCSFVSAVDVPLEDLIHISGAGQHRLGRRLAYAMDVLRRGRKAGKPPIKPRETKVVHDPRVPGAILAISFDNVAGRLRVPEGTRPTGFDLGEDKPGPVIYDTQVEGDHVILRTSLAPMALESLKLHHGYGTNPFCNITDEADRPVPVFGPVCIGTYHALTPMVTHLRVALPVDLSPESGVDPKLHGLAYPGADALARLPWRERTFPARFCDCHLDIEPLRPRDFLIYFACRLDVPERMRLAACLGYDGPVKLWVDGREMFHDPEGTNPAFEDRVRAPFAAEAGLHEVLVALGSNAGKAWGIFLRFERLGLSAKALRQGPGGYAMPSVTP